MRESLFSPLWYRVAGQHPHLRTDVRVQRQTFRDQVWYVLINTITGRQYRLNHMAYQVIGRCDGQHSVQEVWDALLEQFRDDAPTQDEVISMLLQLDHHGMLDYEATRDVEVLVQQRDQRTKQQRRAFLNPLAFRVSLGDPSLPLKRLHRLATALCHPVTLWIWIAIMALAAAAAASNFSALSIHAATYMYTPHYCPAPRWATAAAALL
jgi:putative peptide zinc metalloprotease protein